MSPSQEPFPATPRHASYALHGLHGSVGAARDLTRVFFTGPNETLPEAVMGDVLLVVSELVSNAVRHAPGPCTLSLTQDHKQVIIAVTDNVASLPVPRTADLSSGTGGFGWHLLRNLARHVRITARADGKTITAILPRLVLAGI
ncbi:ATP-binding protein [Streptacidiphilus sp. PAMC 29251]